MARTPVVRITLLGDASSAQKAFKDLEGSAGRAEIGVEGFGKAFAELGLAVGAAAFLKEAGDAVGEYTKKMQDSEATILGVTQSQAALNQAFAFADQELKAGRAAFSDTVAAIAELTPVAKRSGQDVTDLYRTVQLLSTLNSGPEGGVAGAVISLNEVLNGQFTSLQRRFNISTDGIRKAIESGVPPLQAVNDALAKEGVTMDLVNRKSQTTAAQFAILKDSLTRVAAEAGKPAFDKVTSELTLWNKALSSSGMKQFTADLREMIATLTTGHALDDFGIQARKTFYLVGDAFNTMIKGVSGGRLNIDQQLADMRAGIVADESKLRAAVQQGITKPVADELGGKGSGSPVAPEKVVGYGQAMAASFLKGLGSADLDEVDKLTSLLGDLFKGVDGKTDGDQLARAQVILAQALKELASQGQVTDDTMRDLSAAFGLQTPEVYKLLAAYTQYQQALSGVALAQVKVQGATAATNILTEQAAGETKQLQDNLDAATQSAQANADASAAVIEGLQGTLKGVQAGAEEAARRGQAQLDGMQARLTELQAAQSAASQQRSNDQALLNAALAGELEYEEQILDGLTDEQRARAAVWQAEIDGQRRAKEGANQKVTQLSRQAHLEDQKALHEIDALRSSGHAKEARAAERALAAKQKQRAAAMTLAQADAAVANDQFDAAEEQVKKEGQAQDVKDAQAEKIAAKRVAEQQADIKAIQDAQKAEQERYAAQERGIQAEIDKTTEAAKVQAAKDKKTIDDAKTILGDRKAYWDQELLKAGQNATQMANQETSAKNFAGSMKDAYDYAEKISKLDFSNITNAATAAAKLPAGAAPPPSGIPGEGPNAGPDVAPNAADTSHWLSVYGPIGWGPASTTGGSPPAGFHVETRPTGVWWVKDGYTLNDAGNAIKQANPPTPSPGPAPSPAPAPAPPAPGQNTGPGSYPQPGPSPSPAPSGLSRVSGLGPQFQRAAGFGGGAGGGAGGSTINIHLPNVTSLGDPAQRATMWRQIEREWDDVERGGHVKSDTGA